jgi:hypothetical protein
MKSIQEVHNLITSLNTKVHTLQGVIKSTDTKRENRIKDI